MKLFVEANLGDPEDTQKHSLHSGHDAEDTLQRKSTFGIISEIIVLFI